MYIQISERCFYSDKKFYKILKLDLWLKWFREGNIIYFQLSLHYLGHHFIFVRDTINILNVSLVVESHDFCCEVLTQRKKET